MSLQHLLVRVDLLLPLDRQHHLRRIESVASTQNEATDTQTEANDTQTEANDTQTEATEQATESVASTVQRVKGVERPR